MKGVIPRAEVERRAREYNSCPNCGAELRYKLKNGQTVKGGHFFPPSMGEEGFWTCAPPSSAPATE